MSIHRTNAPHLELKIERTRAASCTICGPTNAANWASGRCGTDPRHIHTHAFDNPADEERDRPPMWRYWRALPPKGKLGMLFGSWYTAPIIDRVFRRSRHAQSG